MEQFAGPEAFIIILGTWVMNSTGLPLQLLMEIMASRISMTKFHLLRGSEKVISLISKPASWCVMLDWLRPDGQAVTTVFCTGYLAHIYLLYWSSLLGVPQKLSFNKDFSPQPPQYSRDGDMHVKYFKPFAKVWRFPKAQLAE